MKEDNRWSIATGEDDGRPLIFRIRNQAPAFVKQPDFPHLLAICWPFDADVNNGMPTLENAERMAELENLLEEGLEASCEAFLTVAVTGNGVREWQWYARDRNAVMEHINKTLGELDPFPIEISFQNDPAWQGYNGFLEIITPTA